MVNPTQTCGVGITTLESMACGVITLRMDYSKYADMYPIIDGKTGFKFRNNPKDLAEKIIYVIRNYPKLKKIEKNAREVIVRDFNINNKTEQIIGIYEKLND